MSDTPTPPLVICLDQCAISAIALDWQVNAGAARLRNILLEAREYGEVCCPLPPETMFETANLDGDKRRLVYELQFALAKDYLAPESLVAFKPFWKLLNEETLAMACDSKLPVPFERGIWDFKAFENHVEKTSAKVCEFKEVTKKQFAAHPSSSSGNSISYVEASEIVTSEVVSHLLRQIERLKLQTALDEQAHCAIDLACYLADQGISFEELDRLEKAVVGRKWEAIPALFCRNRIAAKFEADFNRRGSRKAYRPNDEIDLTRVAVGLHSAAVVIADSPIVAVIRELKLDQMLGCEVFSIRELETAATAIARKCDGRREG